MSTMHEVRPGAAYQTDDLDDVVAYLIGRGLAADNPKSAEMFGRLLTLPARSAESRVTVTRAARTFYLSRRAFGRWCTRAGLPQPSRTLAFGRVLRTIQLVRRHDLTLQRAAAETGWPDAFSMSNRTLQLTGMRPSEARERGLIYLAEAWLRRELRTGTAELRAPGLPKCPSCGQMVAVAGGG